MVSDERLVKRDLAALRESLANLTDPKTLREVQAELRRMSRDLEARVKKPLVKAQDLVLR